MKKLLSLFFAIAPSLAFAQGASPVTRPSFQTNMASALPTNGAQVITAADLRGVFTQLSDSVFFFLTDTMLPAGTTIATPILGDNSTKIINSAFLNAYQILTTQLPAPFANGTASGNTNKFATTSGVLTSGNCAQFDVSGNLVASGSGCGNSLSGFTGPTICNLKNQMDTHYGAGSWTYRTAIGNGDDIGPALSECIATFATMGARGIIYVPSSGQWALKTPNIDFSGVYVIGDGSQASVIIANFTGNNTAFAWKGTGGVTAGGMRGIGLQLESGLGTSSAVALLFRGNSSFQPDQTELNDLYVTSINGASTWQTCLQYDGTSRTSPQGIRVAQISNVQLFECNTTGASFLNVVQFSISNLGVYVSSGTGRDIVFSGGGASNTNSIQLVADNVNTANQILLTNISRFFIRGWANTVQVGASTTLGVVQGNMTLSGVCGTGCTVTVF